jgi:hypothetical protein
MTTPVFSINGASEMLERDRRSVQKSLRHVPPDKMVNKQPPWKLATILQALDQLPHARRNKRSDVGIVVHHDWLDVANWRDARIITSLVEFNEAFAEMKAIKDTEQRRAFAIAKLAPLIAFHNRNFIGWETDNPAPGRFANDDVSVSCRVDLLWSQQMEAVRVVCEWTSDECREFIEEHFDEDD